MPDVIIEKTRTRSSNKSKSILLIEDKYLISRKLSDLAEKSLPGYDLKAPRSWSDIYNAILLESYDIIIVDYRFADFEWTEGKLGDIIIEDGVDIIQYLIDQEIDKTSQVSIYTRDNITYNGLNKMLRTKNQMLQTKNHRVRVFEKANFGTTNSANLWLFRKMIDGREFGTLKHHAFIKDFEKLKSPSQDYMFQLLLHDKTEGKTQGFAADLPYIINSVLSQEKDPKQLPSTAEEPNIDLQVHFHRTLDFFLMLKITTPTESIDVYNLDFPEEMLNAIKLYIRPNKYPNWIKRLVKTTIVENLARWVVNNDLQPISSSNENDVHLIPLGKASGAVVSYTDIDEVLSHILDFNLQFSIALFKKYFKKITNEQERNEKLNPWFDLPNIPRVVDVMESEIIEELTDNSRYPTRMKSWQGGNREPTIGAFPEETLAQYGIEGQGAFFEYITYIDTNDIAKQHIIPISKYPLRIKIGQ